jgi:predicted ArsR family transcriptional regulator
MTIQGSDAVSTQEKRDSALWWLLWRHLDGLTVAEVATRLGITPAGARRRLRDAEKRHVVRRLPGRPARYVAAHSRRGADRGMLLVEALRAFEPWERPEAIHAVATILGDEELAKLVPNIRGSRE